ncbi:hypothetical protein EsDP_00007357 [Epichloe bromicola]|uniref:Uncharacterized protein n=1 Tax=Epichloe bromicola TaxID=79588 RepID=A0ABQ0D0C0_9HYPO
MDFSTLSEEDKEKMRSGLQEVLGDDGMRKLTLHVRQTAREREDKKLDKQGTPPPEYQAPDFLQRWQKTRVNENVSWGFVAFRTALYGDKEKWLALKGRVRRILF